MPHTAYLFTYPFSSCRQHRGSFSQKHYIRKLKWKCYLEMNEKPILIEHNVNNTKHEFSIIFSTKNPTKEKYCCMEIQSLISDSRYWYSSFCFRNFSLLSVRVPSKMKGADRRKAQ